MFSNCGSATGNRRFQQLGMSAGYGFIHMTTVVIDFTTFSHCL